MHKYMHTIHTYIQYIHTVSKVLDVKIVLYTFYSLKSITALYNYLVLRSKIFLVRCKHYIPIDWYKLFRYNLFLFYLLQVQVT